MTARAALSAAIIAGCVLAACDAAGQTTEALTDAPSFPAIERGAGAAPTTREIIDRVSRAWFLGEWRAYLAKFVTPDGRVVDNANGGVSHSEGQGYGLLFALGAAIVIGSLYLRRIRQGLMGRPKTFDLARMTGKEGTMQSDLLPPGKGVAIIAAEQWTVTSSQQLKRGDRVRVKGVEGLEPIVEKVE